MKARDLCGHGLEMFVCSRFYINMNGLYVMSLSQAAWYVAELLVYISFMAVEVE